ncbi:MAG: FMN-binding protein [Candidatus Marinimicrobia bacterium]|nr:FMN-binding protein [Candidatus Neomarinimicrobiota bacterium]MBT3731546.1 FMN-binding protein [Candidatus Neomarinimicrobiota bacterium]
MSKEILKNEWYAMRSNTYTLVFTASITVVLGFMLSLAATSLKERQTLNVELDIKKNILIALDIPADGEKYLPEEIQEKYTKIVVPIYVDDEGNLLEETEENDKALPVFIQKMGETIEGYAIPISGKGLWSTLYGYLALESDGKTVKGITFYKHGETPGLGGEVEKKWFTNNYKQKKIVDENGVLVSIQAMKGKADPSSADFYHEVDGVSGATMTTKGLNLFLKENLQNYDSYFQQIRLAQ